MAHKFKTQTLEDFVGNTPLVRLKRLPGRTSNVLLAKLEGNNPAGSVKDRPALSMIRRAQERGDIKPGDTLIEPTSGNTGIALAMCAAMMGYKMVLVMPEHLSHRAPPDHGRFRRRVRADAEGGRNGDGARRGREDERRRARRHPRPVRQSGQSARALRRHRPRDLARHRRAASRIS